MATNVTVKTKIRVNGQAYGSVEGLPADVRQAHERALARMSATTAEQLASGSTQTKLVFNGEDGTTTTRIAANTTIRFNGREYTGVDKMPAALRRLFEAVIATVDANRNGMPDVLETTAQETGRWLLAPTSMTASSAGGGVVRPDSTRSWLVIAGVVVAAMLLAALGFRW
jgi:hypothetical protein